MTVTSPPSSPTQRSGIAAPLRHALAKPLAPYYLVLGSAVLLTVLGLVMVLSASSVESYAASGSSWAREFAARSRCPDSSWTIFSNDFLTNVRA